MFVTRQWENTGGAEPMNEITLTPSPWTHRLVTKSLVSALCQDVAAVLISPTCHAYQCTNLEPTTTMIAELRLPAWKTHITTVAGCSHADLATLPADKNALEATNAYACGMQQLLALS